MNRQRSSEGPVTAGERCATAFAAAIAAALTLLGYFLISLFISRYRFVVSNFGSQHDVAINVLVLFNLLFSRLSIWVICAASVAGFCLGPSRMTEVLSFFWGTHEWWQEDHGWNEKGWAIKLLGAAAIALLVWFFADLFPS